MAETSAQLRARVMEFALSRAGTQVGDGECFALADEGLKGAGAQSAEHFGPVTRDANYKWGSPVSLSAAQQGSVLQFKGHAYGAKATYRLDFPDGAYLEWNDSAVYNRKHHTAVLHSNASASGYIVVMEQKVMRDGVDRLSVRDIWSTMEQKTKAAKSATDKTVGPGIIWVKPATHSSTRVTVIDATLGTEIKRHYRTAADKKLVDELVRKFQGKSLTMKVTIDVANVGGDIVAYDPVAAGE